MKGKALIIMAIGALFAGGCAGPLPDKPPSSEPAPDNRPAHPSDKRQNTRIAAVDPDRLPSNANIGPTCS